MTQDSIERRISAYTIVVRLGLRGDTMIEFMEQYPQGVPVSDAWATAAIMERTLLHHVTTSDLDRLAGKTLPAWAYHVWSDITEKYLNSPGTKEVYLATWAALFCRCEGL